MNGEKQVVLLEGLLPVDVWNALIVLLILFGVFMAVFKGYVAIRDEHRKRKKEKELKNVDLTEEIADKVMEKLEPKIDEKFRAVDEKLANDNRKLNDHDRKLENLELRVMDTEKGQKALSRCVYVMFMKLNGKELTQKQVEEANTAMENYLFGKPNGDK